MAFCSNKANSKAASRMTSMPAASRQSLAFGSYIQELQHQLQHKSRTFRGKSLSGGNLNRQRLSCQSCSRDSPDSLDSSYIHQQNANDIDSEWQRFIRPRMNSVSQRVFPRPSQANASTRPTRAVHSWDEWDMCDEEMFVPYPSNMPVNEVIDSISDIQQWTMAAERAYSYCSPVDMMHGKAYWSELKEVYVILFGVGEKETEGIYSLRALSDDGLPQETIIAFESEEDAERYAGLLEATMEHVPNVCSIPPEELTQFCTDAGYSCRLEQQGSLLIPPHYNVGVTDWERSMRLREGYWSVLEEEPSAHPSQRLPRSLFAGELTGLCQFPSSTVWHMLDSSQEQLAAIRARLESLLESE